SADDGRRLLFFSGDKRRDTLFRRLAEHSCPVDELCVYATKEHPHFVERLQQACNVAARHAAACHQGTLPVVWVAFFSPSGAKLALPHLAGWLQHPQPPDQASTCVCWRVAAIGQTTAAALTEAGIPVHAIAASPSASGLLDAI
ncbi:tetrapyrrole biosynthesis, uroporphyrinogen III synthase, partial [Thamnocephalis sphaerospora]